MSIHTSSDSQIGRFQIEAEIGRGGMGVVYRAIDPSLGRPVAVKLLAPHLDADQTAQRRFQTEATAVARLKHPHIATVYEFGDHQGHPYIVFEWAEGRTLRSLIEADGRLPLARALKIFAQIAQALDYAHQRGVIHRDLKPANIMIGPGDEVTIIDFGLARMASAANVTVSTTFFGTPRYSSPEQIQGAELDGRSDLYSAAVMLYELLAGMPPFDDPSIPALIHKLLNVAPPLISEQRPDLPIAVERALARALAKQPAERFARLSDLAQALGATSLAVSLAAKPAGSARRLWLAAVGGLTMLGLLVALVLTLAPRPATDQPPTEAALVADVPATISPPAPDGLWPMGAGGPARRSELPTPLGPLVTTPRWSHNPRTGDLGPIVAGLGQVYFRARWSSLRAIDWASGEIAWEAELDSGIIGTPALLVSEEQALLFAALDGPRLVALDATSGEQIWLSSEGELEGRISADLVLGENDLLYAISEEGQLSCVDPWNGAVNWQIDLSSAGQFYSAPAVTAGAIFLTSSNDSLLAVSANDGTLLWEVALLGTSNGGPLIDRERNLVLVGTNEGRLHAFFADSGAPSWVAVAGGGIAGLAADADQIYATTYDGAAYAWSAEDGDRRWSLDAEGPISAPPLADGVRVLVATEAGELRFIDAASGVEDEAARLSFQSPLTLPAIAGGGWLFVQSGFIYGFGP